MEPTASIAVIETDLRRLVEHILSANYGPEWQATKLPAELREELDKRLEEERKRRYPASVPNNLLDYCHLYELSTIIDKDWSIFAAALGEKKEFTVLIGKVEDYRNAPSHSRELLAFEKDLLKGISGEIRTKVTVFLSTVGSDSKFYPVIESLVDSFGNRAEGVDNQWPAQVSTKIHLQVGQLVEFSGRAWDPQGRDITWIWDRGFNSIKGSTIGTDVNFTWRVEREDVGRLAVLHVSIASPGPDHRYYLYDQEIGFAYSVDPPR